MDSLLANEVGRHFLTGFKKKKTFRKLTTNNNELDFSEERENKTSSILLSSPTPTYVCYLPGMHHDVAYFTYRVYGGD